MGVFKRLYIKIYILRQVIIARTLTKRKKHVSCEKQFPITQKSGRVSALPLKKYLL